MSIKLGEALASYKPKYSSIEAVVTRADGTVEKLGIIAERHYTIRGRLMAKIKRLLNGRN